MTFLQPTYLWALFFMGIPLIIHLWNKGDVKTVKVGSVKYLREFDTKQSRRIRLNELLLLFLRMLLIGLIVLFLAEPQWKQKIQKSPITYMVDPSLTDLETFASFLDSLPQENSRWFAKGFPKLGDGTNDSQTPDYWQLAQRLSSIPSDSIVVFSKGLAKGFRGLRPTTSKNIKWIMVNDDSTIKEFVGARQVQDSVILYEVSGDSQRTNLYRITMSENDGRVLAQNSDSLVLHWEGKKVKLPFFKNDPRKVAISYDEKYNREMQYFSAALKAVGEYGMYDIDLKKMDSLSVLNDENPWDLLIWLKDGKVPNSKQPVIAIQADSLAKNLIERTEWKNRYRLTRRLNVENAVEGELTRTLAQMLLPKDSISRKMESLDRRVMPDAEMASIYSDDQKETENFKSMDISPWLWIAIFLVLVTERIISKIRKQ